MASCICDQLLETLLLGPADAPCGAMGGGQDGVGATSWERMAGGREFGNGNLKLDPHLPVTGRCGFQLKIWRGHNPGTATYVS